MTITYSDGRAVQAALLSREGDTIRVAIEGAEDVMQFRNIEGWWISEECEAAKIDFVYPRKAPPTDVSEDDCVCSRELAARLLRLLFTGSPEEADLPASSGRPAKAALPEVFDISSLPN